MLEEKLNINLKVLKPNNYQSYVSVYSSKNLATNVRNPNGFF